MSRTDRDPYWRINRLPRAPRSDSGNDPMTAATPGTEERDDEEANCS